LVMPDNIEKHASAVSSQHDLSAFRFAFEFGLRGETGVIQDFSQMDGALKGEKPVTGNKKTVFCPACPADAGLIQSRENRREIFISRLDRRKCRWRARRGFMLCEI